jgi:hypothetical protein
LSGRERAVVYHRLGVGLRCQPHQVLGAAAAEPVRRVFSPALGDRSDDDVPRGGGELADFCRVRLGLGVARGD